MIKLWECLSANNIKILNNIECRLSLKSKRQSNKNLRKEKMNGGENLKVCLERNFEKWLRNNNSPIEV